MLKKSLLRFSDVLSNHDGREGSVKYQKLGVYSGPFLPTQLPKTANYVVPLLENSHSFLVIYSGIWSTP